MEGKKMEHVATQAIMGLAHWEIMGISNDTQK